MSAIHEEAMTIRRTTNAKDVTEVVNKIKQTTLSYLQQYEQRLQALEQQGLAQNL